MRYKGEASAAGASVLAAVSGALVDSAAALDAVGLVEASEAADPAVVDSVAAASVGAVLVAEGDRAAVDSTVAAEDKAAGPVMAGQIEPFAPTSHLISSAAKP